MALHILHIKTTGGSISQVSLYVHHYFEKQGNQQFSVFRNKEVLSAEERPALTLRKYHQPFYMIDVL